MLRRRDQWDSSTGTLISYGSDMKSLIHLIRHGLPNCRPLPALSHHEFKSWVDAYDAAGIIDRPPTSLVEWLKTAGIEKLISSALPRAEESARALVGPEFIRCNPLFNEAAIAVVPFPFRLNSSVWTAVGRLTWLLGAPANEDSATFQLRARAAAAKLMQSADSAETALVGHGWMNRTIGRILREHGYGIQHRGDNRYWSRMTFIR